MPCRSCGKSKARQLAELSKASGIDITDLGPFPNHAPAPVVEEAIVESTSDEA